LRNRKQDIRAAPVGHLVWKRPPNRQNLRVLPLTVHSPPQLHLLTSQVLLPFDTYSPQPPRVDYGRRAFTAGFGGRFSCAADMLLRLPRGSAMDALREDQAPRGRVLNAVALQNAVLCADCDVVSDSPHDRCMVCGSPSLVNISQMLGGTLPQKRATLIETETPQLRRVDVLLTFRRAHTIRRRSSGKTA
jgi:hypothetical protein